MESLEGIGGYAVARTGLAQTARRGTVDDLPSLPWASYYKVES